MSRSYLRSLILLPLFTACGEDGVTTPREVTSVEVMPADGAVVPGGTLAMTAVVRDSEGRSVWDRVVGWTTNGAAVELLRMNSGVVRGVEVGGPVTVSASAEGHIGSAQVSVVTTGSDVLDQVLIRTTPFIAMTLTNSVESLPLNPHLEAEIQLKIAMLMRPDLSSEVVRGRYMEQIVSAGGRDVSIAAVFAADSMRPRVRTSVEEVERILPLLESFMQTPLPAPWVQIWYGFGLGGRGGGGMIDIEDQGTYESTRTGDALPYLAIVGHELSHSYIGHELLTQFLELYLYNVTRTGSYRTADWVHTRGYAPDQAANHGLHAVLDIYDLIGHDAMAEAFRALHALGPRYGEPLSAAARAAIIDRAPPELKDQVMAKVEMIDVGP